MWQIVGGTDWPTDRPTDMTSNDIFGPKTNFHKFRTAPKPTSNQKNKQAAGTSSAEEQPKEQDDEDDDDEELEEEELCLATFCCIATNNKSFDISFVKS